MQRPTRAALALVPALVATAAAAPAVAASTYRFDIAPGRLSDAVAAIGRAAGVSIGVRDAERLPARSPGVHGRMSVRDALLALAAGRGRVVQLDGSTYLLLPAPRTAGPASSPPPPPRVQPIPASPDELVVTAGKRTLALADYPGAVTVIDGRRLGLEAARDGTAAIGAREPVLGSTNLGPGRNKLFLRGVADSSFNGASQATVGEYLGDTRLNYSSPDPDLRLYDVDAVEVLEGPQGTLYGAGSLGGLIRITPTAPRLDRASGRLWAGGGLTAHGGPGYDVGGVLNLPLMTDRAGLRAVAYDIRDGGYIDDVARGVEDVNRVHTAGGRLAGRLDAGGWTVDAVAAVQSIRSADSQYAQSDVGPLARRGQVAEPARQDFALASLAARRELGALHLSSTTGVVRQTLDETFDASQPGGLPRKLAQQTRVSLVSHETRLSHDLDGAWGWLAGLSLVRSSAAQARQIGPAADPPPLGDVTNRVLELTAYGQATYSPIEALKLTAGLRLSHMSLSGEGRGPTEEPETDPANGDGAGSRSQTRVSPSLAAVWRPVRPLSLFVRYEQGYRPGGLAVSFTVARYRGDRLSTVEAGARYASPGGRLAVALTGAHADWSDVQADVLDGFGLARISNVGDGVIWSADLKAQWRPVDTLTLTAAAFAARARLSLDSIGIIIVNSAPLPNVAPIGGRIGAEYRRPLADGREIGAWAALRYVGKSALGVGPVLGLPQGDYAVASAGLSYEAGPFGLSLTVENLLDSHANSFAFGTPFTIGLGNQVTPLRPRTVRVGVDRRF